MTHKINSADSYSLDLGQSDEVLSVIQNVSLILNAKKGTIPMHRDFGLPMEFVDKPLDVAETIAVAEITDALEKFEPRAKLVDLTFEKTKDGEMSLVVEVSIVEG